jgi:hypothetical protein
MWILQFIPDSYLEYIVNATLIIGAISTFLSFFVINRILRWFPGMAPYYTTLQIVSVAVLLSGVYFKGGYSTEQVWRERVANLEAKVAEAEVRADEANSKIKTVVKNKLKIIRDVQYLVEDRIVERAVKIDADCRITPDTIGILNDAARNSIKDKK